jgi:hypothetical protein
MWLVSIVWKRKRENGLTLPIVTVSDKVKQKTRTTLANAAKIGMGIVLGMGAIDLWQYHHTFILWDLTVVAEPGDRINVDGRQTVVPSATFYFQRASGPSGQIFPRTFCPKYVPGLHDGYHVEVIAAAAEHYPIECWNVAPTPLGIVYNVGTQGD